MILFILQSLKSGLIDTIELVVAAVREIDSGIVRRCARTRLCSQVPRPLEDAGLAALWQTTHADSDVISSFPRYIYAGRSGRHDVGQGNVHILQHLQSARRYGASLFK